MTSRVDRPLLVAVASTVLVTACAAWLLTLRQVSGEWELWPAAAPARLTLFDRTYLRGTNTNPADPAAAPVGTTLGGGTIVSTPPVPYVPTVVWVLDGDRTTGYALSGGP